MSEYIKKDDIIKWVDDSVAQCGNRYSADMLNMMDMFKTVVDNCLPFANVVPAELYQRALNDVITLSAERKHGKWIDEALCSTSGYGVYHVNRCSECRSAEPMLSRKNFCPNCGADMRGES